MNKDEILVPKYRFPKFKNGENWKKEYLGEILSNESSSLSINKLSILSEGYELFGADGLVGYIDSYQQKEDYIAIVKDGSGAGRLSYYPAKSSVVGTLTYLKVKDNSKNDLKFQYYNIHNIDFKNHIKGGGIPHIYYSDYKNDLIGNSIDLAEQQKIAACLSSLDDVIAGHEDKLKVLEEHKRGLMQNLFPKEETRPKFRFPEFANDGDWVEKKIGELGDPLMCKRIFKEETTTVQEGHIPFYKIGTFGKNPDSFITVEKYLDYKKRFSFPQKGDILISASGTIGRLVIYDGAPAYFQDSNIIWLGHKENQLLNSFLHYVYQTLTWQTSDGGIISRLYNSDFKNMAIKFPENFKEQQKIAELLSSVDELIVAQREKIEALKEHKKGLMQGLFPKIKS